MTRSISAARDGVTRSSASTESTQSPEASPRAKFRWLAKSSNATNRHDVGMLPGDFQGRVATGRVDDDDALKGPARGRQAVREVVPLVLRDDQDRQAGLRHTEPPS